MLSNERAFYSDCAHREAIASRTFPRNADSSSSIRGRRSRSFAKFAVDAAEGQSHAMVQREMVRESYISSIAFREGEFEINSRLESRFVAMALQVISNRTRNRSMPSIDTPSRCIEISITATVIRRSRDALRG